jgi:hypothetical protein
VERDQHANRQYRRGSVLWFRHAALGTANPGFYASSNGVNPAPKNFELNGTACTSG